LNFRVRVLIYRESPISGEEESMGKVVIEQLKGLIQYVEDLEMRVRCARYHINKHIDAYTPGELECLYADGVLQIEDIPPDKRTEYIKDILKRVVDNLTCEGR
jgi:hypothetical protein